MPGNEADDENLVLVGGRADVPCIFDHFLVCRYASQVKHVFWIIVSLPHPKDPFGWLTRRECWYTPLPLGVPRPMIFSSKSTKVKYFNTQGKAPYFYPLTHHSETFFSLLLCVHALPSQRSARPCRGAPIPPIKLKKVAGATTINPVF